MGLYHLLNERGCLNVLKELYDVEFVLKTSRTLKISELQKKIPEFIKIDQSSLILEKEGLIAREVTDEDTILSITNKGKNFFEQFDKLKKTYEGEEVRKSTLRIEYDLTALERRILTICYKLQQEFGTIVPLRNLTQEVYPHRNPSNRIGAISKYVSKLVDLNLMEKVKTEQKSYAKVTESGERVIKEQFMENTI